MTTLGHNQGPSMEPGHTWRKHCWSKARADLLPRLPIEILRRRVSRAKELGLEYKTYASVRASTGRDVIGFLFSSNALRAFVHAPTIPEPRQTKLSALTDCKRIALVSSPLTIASVSQANPTPLDFTNAPTLLSGWSETARLMDTARHPFHLPADAVLLVGDTALEQEWAAAGRLAGYIPADRFFPTTA